MILLLTFFLSVANADFWPRTSATGYPQYGDRAECEKENGKVCVDVGICDPEICTPNGGTLRVDPAKVTKRTSDAAERVSRKARLKAACDTANQLLKDLCAELGVL